MNNINTLVEKCETISSGYAQKNSINRTQDWFLFKLQEELGELTKAYVNFKGLGRKNDKSPEQLKSELADELADVLGYVLLFAKHNDIDLEKLRRGGATLSVAPFPVNPSGELQGRPSFVAGTSP